MSSENVVVGNIWMDKQELIQYFDEMLPILSELNRKEESLYQYEQLLSGTAYGNSSVFSVDHINGASNWLFKTGIPILMSFWIAGVCSFIESRVLNFLPDPICIFIMLTLIQRSIQ